MGIFFDHTSRIHFSTGPKNPITKKYGKIAITVVQADYPEVEITDYEYKGRKTVAKKSRRRRFQIFWSRIKVRSSMSS
ncbi:DUF3889 domain-containing protein [Peribacillus frigoritolerans]|nr:DUF3889 domain-containing protein [Peribacillus frigoritolerans]